MPYQMLTRAGASALGVAALWSVALWFLALTVPVYSGSTTDSDGSVAESSQTLVGENGLSAVVVVSIPLVVTLLVAGALTLMRRPAGLYAAWTLTGVFAAFNLVAMLSVGIFLLPVTISLAVACLASRTRQPAPAGS